MRSFSMGGPPLKWKNKKNKLNKIKVFCVVCWARKRTDQVRIKKGCVTLERRVGRINHHATPARLVYPFSRMMIIFLHITYILITGAWINFPTSTITIITIYLSSINFIRQFFYYKTNVTDLKSRSWEQNYDNYSRRNLIYKTFKNFKIARDFS